MVIRGDKRREHLRVFGARVAFRPAQVRLIPQSPEELARNAKWPREEECRGPRAYEHRRQRRRSRRSRLRALLRMTTVVGYQCLTPARASHAIGNPTTNMCPTSRITNTVDITGVARARLSGTMTRSIMSHTNTP